MKKNIISLCGFMGAGKTTVGKKLAELLEYDFFDCDEYIEKSQNMSVSEIFDRFGESIFRKKETDALISLTEKDNIVLSLGGGAVMNPENLDFLKKTVLVFIDTPFQLIYERLENDSSRPIIKNSDKNSVSDLYLKRHPFYKSAADYTISADENAEATARKIIDVLNHGG